MNLENITIGIDLSYNSTGLVVKHPTSTGYHYEFFNIVPKTKKHSSNIEQVTYTKIIPPEQPTYTQIDAGKIWNSYNITATIMGIIKRYPRSITVNLEGNIFTAGVGAGQRAIDLTMLNTIVKLELTKIENVKEVYVFAPTSVKKVFTGSGRAKKEDMISTFTTLYPDFDITGKIDDCIDAYALCQCDGKSQPAIKTKPKKKRKPKK